MLSHMNGNLPEIYDNIDFRRYLDDYRSARAFLKRTTTAANPETRSRE